MKYFVKICIIYIYKDKDEKKHHYFMYILLWVEV